MKGGTAIRNWTCTFAAFALAIVFLHLAASGDTADSQAVVATINGKPITRQELVDALFARRGKLLLRQMIDEMLIEQAARRRKVSATPAEVDAELNRVKARYPSSDQFNDELKKSGRSLDQLRHLLRLKLLVTRISRSEAKVPEKEIQDYYEAHRKEFVKPESVLLRDMLLDTKENAEELRKVLKSGGDFAGLARSFSLDPATKNSGGDMGIIAVSALTAPLAKAVKEMVPGQISPVIEAPDGFYLLKVEKKFPGRQRPYKEARAEILSKLVEKHALEIQSELVKRLRSGAKIQITDDRLR